MEELRIAFFMEIYRDKEEIYRSVGSVLQQTYSNICLNICTDIRIFDKLYSKFKDKRLVFVDREICNIRTSQRGYVELLKKLAGNGNKFICTLDADDWYEQNFAEKAVCFLKENKLEVVACGSKIYIGEKEFFYRKSELEYIWKNAELPEYYIYIQDFYRAVWGKLYTSELILRLDDSIFYENSEIYGGWGGDTMICNEILKNASKMGVMTEVLHNYQISFSNNASSSIKQGRILGIQLLYESNIGLLENYGEVSMQNIVFLDYLYAGEINELIMLLNQKNLPVKQKLSFLRDVFLLKASKKHIEFAMLVEKTSLPSANQRECYTKKILGQVNLNNCGLFITEYYEIFSLLYPDKSSIITQEIFSVLLKNKLINIFAERDSEKLTYSLLELLGYKDNKEGEKILKTLKVITEREEFRKGIITLDFAKGYLPILKLVAKKRIDEAERVIKEVKKDNEELPLEEELEQFMKYSRKNFN